MMTVGLVYDPIYLKHDTGAHVENSRRLVATMEVLEEDASVLENREVGEVILNFTQPIVIDDFNYTPELGRFVIEKNLDTAGGGIITELGGK